MMAKPEAVCAAALAAIEDAATNVPTTSADFFVTLFDTIEIPPRVRYQSYWFARGICRGDACVAPVEHDSIHPPRRLRQNNNVPASSASQPPDERSRPATSQLQPPPSTVSPVFGLPVLVSTEVSPATACPLPP